MSMIVEEAKLLIESKSPLGEGPIWDMERQVLWWTDILRGVVHCYNPADDSNRTWEIGQMVGMRSITHTSAASTSSSKPSSA